VRSALCMWRRGARVFLFSLKIKVDGFLRFGLKTGGDSFFRFGLKTSVDFLVEPQNQGGTVGSGEVGAFSAMIMSGRGEAGWPAYVTLIYDNIESDVVN
jgi:hypothetical protein